MRDYREPIEILSELTPGSAMLARMLTVKQGWFRTIDERQTVVLLRERTNRIQSLASRKQLPHLRHEKRIGGACGRERSRGR